MQYEAENESVHPAAGMAPVWGDASPLLHGIVLGSLTLSLLAFSYSAFCSVFSSVCDFSAIYLYREDRWLLFAQVLLLLAACGRLTNGSLQLRFPGWAVPLLAAGLIVLCCVGARWVLFGHPFSRDEQMAVFDSQIFHAARLVQPLPPLWQSHAAALNTMFILPASHPVAWVSAYLPMNAVLRTVVGFVADPALTGPLMVALGLVFLWKCARLLWPTEREAAVVAVLLYIGSGQVLFAGMTAFAMPAHLALNLLWLWCFLLNRRSTDIAALLVAFVATGLHQPLFHPLFAAPILFTLLRERNWRRVGLYAIGYGAIGLFWLWWPVWMHALVSGPGAAQTTAGTDYFSRFLETVSQPRPMRWQETGANLLRFFAWQHLLLVPLMVCGIAAARRERLAGAFAAAAILPLCVMALILPFQGIGFGYRYLHGAIGAAILLGVCGWRRVSLNQSWLRPLLVRTTIAGLIVLLPLEAWMAYRLYAPFVAMDRRIATSGADYFIIDSGDGLLASDRVINRPDLSNRPLRLLGEHVDDGLIRAICRPGIRVAMPAANLFRPGEAYFFMPHSSEADRRFADMSPRLRAAGCTVERISGP